MLCERFRSERAHSRSLVIAHASLADAAGVILGGESVTAFGLSLTLRAGADRAAPAAWPGVHCATGELPFIDGAFRCVTLYHVIASGDEAELREACRVLAPGGDLIIVGLNHCGWTGFDSGAWAEVPRLRPARVRRKLRELDMVLAGHLGAGLLGRSRPGVMEQAWQRPIVSVADVVLLHARHVNRPFMTLSRLKSAPAGLAPTAIAGR